MFDDFIKVAAAGIEIKLCDVKTNTAAIVKEAKRLAKSDCKVIVFPELCITGYSLGELFFQEKVLDGAIDGLFEVAKATASLDAVIFVGLPLLRGKSLYNVAACLCHGQILGFVPKSNIPSYGEFYEGRFFTPAPDCYDYVSIRGEEYPFGNELLFGCEELPHLVIGAEICEDLWVPDPPSSHRAMDGATVIVNLSASDELTGKAAYRRQLVESQSARLYCGYIYSNAGTGESTQDVVYSGHSLICENGRLLAEKAPFVGGSLVCDIDLGAIMARRRQMNNFSASEDDPSVIGFSLKMTRVDITRSVSPTPFVPRDEAGLSSRCEEILDIQSRGLSGRLSHIGCSCAVIGISGGLDSTLALLVTARAFDILKKDRKGIIAITMPGFGTTDRTYENALRLCKNLGVTLREIPIADSVRQHFSDIGHAMDVYDVTYENSQARERTQILMDVANMEGGIVVGTGDLSELALGWATYNGDHMSMYGVNASVPKTLVRHLVRYFATECCGRSRVLRATLLDILDTPVSPELLPPEDGKISQKTEDIVGPYELHDFFLYYHVRYGYRPRKVLRLAESAFGQEYSRDDILLWMKVFYSRFFAQQFKRSCLPDGPKVGTVALSPRGDLRMPSDASGRMWIEEVDELRKGKKA